MRLYRVLRLTPRRVLRLWGSLPPVARTMLQEIVREVVRSIVRDWLGS